MVGAGGGSGTDCTPSGGYCSATESAEYRIHNGLGDAAGGYYQGYSVEYAEALIESCDWTVDLSAYGGGIAGIGQSGGCAYGDESQHTQSPYCDIYNPDFDNHNSGYGGAGGSGGTISVSRNATIYAYNGNIYTDGTPYNDGANQCFIYAQSGKTVSTVILPPGNGCRPIEGYSIQFVPEKNINVSGYVNPKFQTGSTTKTFALSETVSITKDMRNQGVGSGAGYIEVSNGTYNIYSEGSNGEFVK